VTSARSSSSAARRRGAAAAATAESLVDATLEAIADIGMAGATVEEISRRAGVTQGALFHHFATRRELLLAAIARHDARFGQRIATVVENVDGDPGRVDPSELLSWLLRRVHTADALVWLELLVGARTDAEMYGDVTRRITGHWSTARSLLLRHPALATLSPEALDIWLDIVEDFLAGEMIWSLADRGRGPGEPTNAEKVATLVELAGAIDPRLVPESSP
jgi:AcrR family transcriptional regulator